MNGYTALVTGAGSGLGPAIAARLADDGWHVAVNDINPDTAERTVAAITDAGGSATAAVADITDPHATTALALGLDSAANPIGAVVLNATGPQPNIALADTNWDDVDDQLAFFARAPLHLTRIVAPLMGARGWGRIVHIDSEVTTKLPPHRTAYVTAKAAQIGLMRAAALECAPAGITVNSVAPGFIPVERHAHLADEELEDYRSTIPVGDLGSPADVAAAVSFLASPEAGFITGQRIVVDGGRHLT